MCQSMYEKSAENMRMDGGPDGVPETRADGDREAQTVTRTDISIP